MLASARSLLKQSPAAMWGARQVARAMSFSGAKTYSAMIRVRNEERYLEPAVLSILDSVSEIVVIDNRSTDRTPAIIERLVGAHPGKVRGVSYDHDVARPGAENKALYTSPGGPSSPRLLANFYNWCLAQCSQPFILKWDGDMIATATCRTALDAFRTDRHQVLYFFGVNIFRDGRRALANYPIADDEPRVFYRRNARYVAWEGGSCEGLLTPFMRPELGLVTHAEQPLYVHMKYCKADAFTNESNDEQLYSKSVNLPGAPVEQPILDAVERWRLMDGVPGER